MSIEPILHGNITHFKESEKLELVLSEQLIKDRVKEIGKQISKDYRDRCPILIGVLNGCFIFLADLIRYLEIECEVDFIKISSYLNETRSSGTVRLIKDISCNITHRDIIIVEDIIDSGLTINFLKRRIEGGNPRSIAFVSLLYKKDVARVDFPIDYVGFVIPNKYVVGYGLDLSQRMRGLSSIYALREE